jgi:hypothetical protein
MSAGACALAPCRAAALSSGSSAWHTSSGPIVLVVKLSSRFCLLSRPMDVSGARPSASECSSPDTLSSRSSPRPPAAAPAAAAAAAIEPSSAVSSCSTWSRPACCCSSRCSSAAASGRRQVAITLRAAGWENEGGVLGRVAAAAGRGGEWALWCVAGRARGVGHRQELAGQLQAQAARRSLDEARFAFEACCNGAAALGRVLRVARRGCDRAPAVAAGRLREAAEALHRCCVGVARVTIGLAGLCSCFFPPRPDQPAWPAGAGTAPRTPASTPVQDRRTPPR